MDILIDKNRFSKISFNDPVFEAYLSDLIVEHIEMTFVILCLGTDKDISDCLGPLTGDFLLKNEKFPFPVFGTLSNPVHNENLQFNLDIIRHRFPKHSVLLIDAAMGEKTDFGEIITIGKNQTFSNESFDIKFEQSDFMILGISDYEGSHDNWLNSVRLHTIYEMASAIANAIAETVKNNSLYQI